MTTRAIEAIYQEIATLVNDAIPEPWTRAWIDVVQEGETSLDLAGWYETTTTEMLRSFPIPLRVTRDLAELRRRIHGPKGELWQKGTFHLNAEGKFRLDLEYAQMP